MRAASDERGFTMIEMIVSILLTLVIYGVVISVLQVFMKDNNNNTARNTQQSSVRTAIDQLARQMRSLASPTAGSAGALEVAGPYQLIFQAVEPGTAFGGSNAANQFRVRYCLSASAPDTPSNETLYKQTQTWTTASAPAIPATSSCPNAAWTTQSTVISNLTNQINGQNRPLFAYAPLNPTSTSQINVVEPDMFTALNPGKQPGETELKSGIFLRNSFAPPITAFTLSQVNHHVLLDASTSTDPNGQTLTYQWYLNGVCPAPTGAITGATTQQYDAGTFTVGSVQTFALVATDTGGLNSCASTSVTIT